MIVELTFATQLNTRTLHNKQLNIKYKAFLWENKFIKKKTTLSTSFINKAKNICKNIQCNKQMKCFKIFFFLNNTFFLIAKCFLLQVYFLIKLIVNCQVLQYTDFWWVKGSNITKSFHSNSDARRVLSGWENFLTDNSTKSFITVTTKDNSQFVPSAKIWHIGACIGSPLIFPRLIQWSCTYKSQSPMLNYLQTT